MGHLQRARNSNMAQGSIEMADMSWDSDTYRNIARSPYIAASAIRQTPATDAVSDRSRRS